MKKGTLDSIIDMRRDYRFLLDDRPEFTKEEKKELSKLSKNQDKDVPF